MMKHEFETLAGYEVSEKNWNIIEAMYMATDLDKQEFIKTLNKKHFALPTIKALKAELNKRIAHQREIFHHYTDSENDEAIKDICEALVERTGKMGYLINYDCIRACYKIRDIEFYNHSYHTVETVS